VRRSVRLAITSSINFMSVAKRVFDGLLRNSSNSRLRFFCNRCLSSLSLSLLSSISFMARQRSSCQSQGLPRQRPLNLSVSPMRSREREQWSPSKVTFNSTERSEQLGYSNWLLARFLGLSCQKDHDYNHPKRNECEKLQPATSVRIMQPPRSRCDHRQ